MKYDLTTNESSNVLRPSIIKRLRWMPQIQGDIIDMLPDEENHVLLAIDGMGTNASEDSVFKLSLDSSKIYIVQPSKNKISNWMTDRLHKVRIGIYSWRQRQGRAR